MTITARVLFGLVIICLVFALPISIAQSTDKSESFVPEKIVFVGEKSLFAVFNDEAVLERTLNIIAENDTNLENVTLIASPLYSMTSGDSIPNERIHFSRTDVNVLAGSTEKVTVQIKVSNQKAGTYEGYAFALYGTNNVARIDLELVLKENSAIGLLTVLVVMIIFITTFYILRYCKLTKKKNFIMSLALLSLGTGLIFTSSPFDSTINLALTSLLITPLIGYVVSILNYERDFRKKRQDLSYDYRNKMVQEDSQIIRSIIGELTIHYASYNADDWPRPSKISDEMWKKSDKVGIVSDTHASLLARYYRYLPLYNECVAKLLELGGTHADKLKTLKKDFAQIRDYFCEAETYLYNTLIYDLRLLQQTYLAEELVSFPIHTSELLRLQLIGFGIVERNANIDYRAFSEDNASKFTTKISKLFNDVYARIEISLDSFLAKLTEIEKAEK